MVNPPSEVSLKGVSKIVPVRILNKVWVEFTEDIYESPGHSLLVSVAGVNVEIDIVHALVRMVDINRLWRDVEISNPDRRHIRTKRSFKMSAQPPKPGHFNAYFSEEIE